MGEDARWVCHTCKTVCNRGGRVLAKGAHTMELVDAACDMLEKASGIFPMDELAGDISSFLGDLRYWLSRHQHHKIHIGSDYTTDIMNLDDYRNESVDGKVSDATRLEMRTKSYEDWRATRIEQIQEVIGKYTILQQDTLYLVATELYDKFSAFSSKEV